MPSITSPENMRIRNKYGDPQAKLGDRGLWHIHCPRGNFAGVGRDWCRIIPKGPNSDLEPVRDMSVVDELNALVSISVSLTLALQPRAA